MKFSLVLLVLGWRLRWLASRNAGFQKQLENRNVVMQWRTFAGKVVSKAGIHSEPTVTLNFKNARYAFATLQQAGKNQMAFMEGMQAGDIKIEGDPGQLMWFMTLMKFIMPGGKK